MRQRGGFTYMELLCVMTIIVTVWILMLPILVRARDRADETNCLDRLRNISWALRMYANDYCGHLPPEVPGLRALTPRYLHDNDAYRCPTPVAFERRWADVLSPAPVGTVDYLYQSGLAMDDRPAEVVAWDNKPRHRGGGNVLYLSGRVIWMDGTSLAALGAARKSAHTGAN